ncbi:MAG: DNA alkylation repair protein [Anaerolineae bacterium]
MNSNEARDLSRRITAHLRAGKTEEAHALLAPVLVERTPFRLLGLIGEAVGAGPLAPINAFLGRIASDGTEGGWVVIGKALGQQLDSDLAGAFDRCRAYIMAGDVWYCADILAERVPGPALVADFGQASGLLTPWREDDNAWVRRAVGVAVHFWAKRSQGVPELRHQTQALLDLMTPMFEEWEMDAVKGVGWGLKTLGRHYPDLVADWLASEIVPNRRHHRALMLRKALTYLSPQQRARALGDPA